MCLMRADVGEFVVTFFVVLLGFGGLVREPVGSALHLLLRIGMALAMFIHDGGLFGFRPFWGNPVDLIGHDSHSSVIRCGPRSPKMHGQPSPQVNRLVAASFAYHNPESLMVRFRSR